mmetsp:Transcript_30694/g.60072  ORF Transcript_30694/g.60072 Transcript_30694/m.60072 type:complete len:278 (+) Transcript_30694:946-1779(+)
MAPHKLLRKSKGFPELTDLVLVVVLEGLDDAAHVTELADQGGIVVVGLDHLGVGRDDSGGRLDEVRSERTLSKQHLVDVELEVLDGLLGDNHEGISDDLAFPLRTDALLERRRLLAVDLGSGLKELVLYAEYLELESDVVERLNDRLGLIHAHETVVDMNRVYPLWTDGLLQQSSANCGVNTTTDEHKHVVVSNLLTDLLDGFLLTRLRREVTLKSGNLLQEVVEHLHAVLRKIHLRMELHTVHAPLGVLDGSRDTTGTLSDLFESGSNLRHAVSVS